ncbi:MAG: hypothetical protein ABIT37_23485 [Luteolibacter sp.]
MNLRKFKMIGSLTAFAAGGALLAPPLARAEEQGVEELTRGPVHEAFAASVNFDPEPGVFVKTAPPGAIEEVPPDQRPEGDNVSWIPGYWGWDDEQSDFIWISGVWRNLPPGRQWVPGYWGEVGSQWQWTSGYWADEEAEEVTYVPKPPKSIESGPNVEAPSRNHIWVSGTWVNRDDRYAWRPGYWQAGQENWSWTPAHYQWAPRGYIFVDGYWDYPVVHRGVVFAPVHFQHEYYDRPNYSYTPAVVIALGVFADHLFVRPNYGHYYYGDYYAPRYQSEGFYASFSYSSGHRGYDPIYMQSRWQHRDDRDWERGRRENFAYYQTHEDARPPRTWAAMQSRPMAARQGQRDNYQFAETLPQYANRSKGQRFQTVSAENRKEIVARNQQVRKFSKDRQQLENRPNDQATEGADKRIQAKREKFEKSPVVGKRPDQLSGNQAPPKRPKNADVRDPKIAGPAGKGGNNGDEPKNADRPNKGNRDGGAQPENGKGKDKNQDQPRGKNDGPAIKPDGNNDGRPDQKGEPKMKEKNQDNTRPERNPDGDKPNKADNPNRTKNEPDQPKKQTEQPETKPKKEREQQAEQPKRQAEPQPKRQAEPQPKRQAEPEPKRQAEPQPKHQAQPEPKRQAEPQPKRQAQPEPKRQAEPQPKRQAEPQPKRQAEPQQQRQAKPDREPTAGKEPAANKKKDKEEDPDAKKKN